jgi:hypothetical protein
MALSIRTRPASLFAALACAASLLVVADARASFVVDFYEGSTLVKSLSSSSGAPISVNGTVGDFSVDLKYQLLTAVSGLQAIVTAGQASVTNNDARNAHTLTIYAIDQGTLSSAFPGPPGQGLLSGVLTTDPGNGNSLLAKSITGNSAIPPRLLSSSGLIASDYEVRYLPKGTFSVVSFEAFRLLPGGAVTFSQGNPGFSDVNMPAPPSIALAMAGLPCVGCYWLYKRRRGLSRTAG